MNKDLFDRWLVTLRSTAHGYGREVLRHESEWSPLGLLCDLIDAKGWERNTRYGFWEWHGNSLGLPISVARAAGITSDLARDLFRLQQACAGHEQYARIVAGIVRPTPGPTVELPEKVAKGKPKTYKKR